MPGSQAFLGMAKRGQPSLGCRPVPSAKRGVQGGGQFHRGFLGWSSVASLPPDVVGSPVGKGAPPVRRINRWILEMKDYHYIINYKSGKKNVVADQLSRPVRPIRP